MSCDDTDQSIPIVDFQPLSIDKHGPIDTEQDAEVHKVCNDICDAFRNMGFVYLKNTGITEKQVKDIFMKAKEFFLLPPESKSKFPYDVIYGGWSDNEWTKGLRDLKEHLDIYPQKMVWPDDVVPPLKKVTMGFFDNCTELSHRLIKAISVGLQLPDTNYLNSVHSIKEGQTQTLLRLLYYPGSQPDSENKAGQIRLGEHTDYGTITLLFQDQVGGLEIHCPDGVFRPAPPVPGTILVFIADHLQIWSTDRLQSTIHRVVAPDEEWKRKKIRQSVAFFVEPNRDTIVRCLDGSDKYEAVCAYDHFRERNVQSYPYL